MSELATKTKVAAATIGPGDPHEMVTHSVQPATPKAKPPHSATSSDGVGFGKGKDMHSKIDKPCAEPYSGGEQEPPYNGWPLSCGRARCYHDPCRPRTLAQLKPAAGSFSGLLDGLARQRGSEREISACSGDHARELHPDFGPVPAPLPLVSLM